MKCKHKLCYTSSTAPKQVLRPTRTARKPSANQVLTNQVLTNAVVSENIIFWEPCQGTGQPWGSWGWRELGWVSPHGNFLPWPTPGTSKCTTGPSSPQGHVPDGSCGRCSVSPLQRAAGSITCTSTQPVTVLPHLGKGGKGWMCYGNNHLLWWLC